MFKEFTNCTAYLDGRLIGTFKIFPVSLWIAPYTNRIQFLTEYGFIYLESYSWDENKRILWLESMSKEKVDKIKEADRQQSLEWMRQIEELKGELNEKEISN